MRLVRYLIYSLFLTSTLSQILYAERIKQIFMFRHGETDWNRQDRYQGHIDIGINEEGQNQAIELAKKLEEHCIQIVLSSDLSRGFETAAIVGKHLGVQVHKDARLRGVGYGKAEGLTRSQLEEKYGSLFVRQWHSLKAEHEITRFPGGESGLEVRTRATQVIIDFFDEHPEIDRVGIASHRGVIRRLLQATFNSTASVQMLANTGLAQLFYDSESKSLKLAAYPNNC